jgi:Spy/CpxP family protein refolding chaperone
MSRQTKTRILSAGVLLAVFGAGVLLGFAADTTFTPPPASASVMGPGDADAAADTDEPRRTPMYEQVGPDSAQSVEIAALVEAHRARMDALNREFQENYDPRYRAIVEETREAIKQVFTPEQAARYQEIVEERDRRRAAEEAANPDDE